MANIKDFRGILVYTGGGNSESITFANTNYKVKDFVLLDIYGTASATIVTNYVNMAKNICKVRADARIWIGTLDYSSSKTRTISEMKSFLTAVKDKLLADTTGKNIWNNNVKGVYMNMEAVYGAVNYTSASTLLNNPCIKLANDLSYFVHTTLKTGRSLDFLWIPYYGYGTNAATIIKNIGYVAAKTTIFDLIVIQPHYYFDTTVEANLAGVKASTDNNLVCYRDKVKVLSDNESYSTSTIGFEMELDSNIGTKSSIYQKYVDTFNGIKNKSVPICFYAGGNASLNNSTVLSKIKSFYS